MKLASSHAKIAVIAAFLSIGIASVSFLIGLENRSLLHELRAESEADSLRSQVLDNAIQSWVHRNPQTILDSVNSHVAELEKENQPQPDDILALQDELFAADQPSFGAPANEAKIQIVEFFDFQCGYCRRMSPIITELVEKNPDLRIVLHDMPILGPNSVLAAKAARAAELQGAYEKFYKAIYSEQTIDQGTIDRVARSLGLDMDKFTADMNSENVALKIHADLELGQSLKIRGTPFFAFKDTGVIFPGAVTFDQLQSAINEIRTRN